MQNLVPTGRVNKYGLIEFLNLITKQKGFLKVD